MHPNALLNVGEIKLVGVPQLTGAGISVTEGCRGGLKTLKRGENVDDSVVDVLKGETGAKVSKLKKKGSSMCSVFFQNDSIETPKIYAASFSFSHWFTLSSARMSSKNQIEDESIEVRVAAIAFFVVLLI